MSDFEHEQDQGTDDAEESRGPADESASLEGLGWDILVGGKDNPFALGGEDPFDLSSEDAADRSESGSPFADDAEVDAILEGLSELASDLLTGEMPDDAFWDRGRGAETPEPSPSSDESAEPPPRDLSPEDLGYRPTSEPVEVAGEEAPAPAAEPETPVGGPISAEPAVIAETEEVAEELAEEPETAAPASPITDDEIDALLSEPASQPSPSSPAVSTWAAPVPQSFAIYDPFKTDVDVKLSVTPAPDLPLDKEMENLLITPERINALWDEINETYGYVVDDVRGHFSTTERAIADLKRARELLLAGAENFDNAEELVFQVKSRLRLEEKVRQWSRARGTWLGAYLILWFTLLVLAILVSNRVQVALEPHVLDWVLASLLPGLFGGLGGVVGALWVLIKHIVKKRDFDPIHTPWYVTNPFMGIALGVVTYLVVRGGGGILSSVAGTSTEYLSAASPALYLLCVVVGFQQNVLWSLIDRFVNAVMPERREDEVAATDVTGEGTSGPQG